MKTDARVLEKGTSGLVVVRVSKDSDKAGGDARDGCESGAGNGGSTRMVMTR